MGFLEIEEKKKFGEKRDFAYIYLCNIINKQIRRK